MILAYIPSPTISQFSIGPVTIHIYALCILMGIVLAVWITTTRWKKLGGNFDQVLDITLVSVPAGAFAVRVKRRSLGAVVGFNYRGHHAHLVDRGTVKRPHPITGTSGIMPANRFWSDTADQDWKKGMDMMMATVQRAVTRIMMRQQ